MSLKRDEYIPMSLSSFVLKNAAEAYEASHNKEGLGRVSPS